DIDRGRCRPEFEAAICQDLAWLGLTWAQPVRRQSEHFDTYAHALDRLRQRGLIYPCFCTRADIQREIKAAGAAPHLNSNMGPDGPMYPGTCRHLSDAEHGARIAAGVPFAWRLDTAAALKVVGPLSWHDDHAGEQRATPEIF